MRNARADFSRWQGRLSQTVANVLIDALEGAEPSAVTYFKPYLAVRDITVTSAH
jgi:hypothetical protein